MSEPGATGPNSAPGLRISYLIQQFPVPTETFAVSDIAALKALGHQVSVYTLKPPRRAEATLATLCGVPFDLPVYRPGWRGSLSWPRLLWRRRSEAGWLALRALARMPSAPVAALQALLCIPRLVEIAEQAGRESDVVHAFWSRHVALVLPLLDRARRPCLRTAFVGAYDLVADDFILELGAVSTQILFSHAEVNRPFLERKAAPGAAVAIVHRGIPLMARDAGAERDPFRIITASALVESKNVDAVIRSFAEARAHEHRLTLRIYGDGPDRARLEALAARSGCADAISFGGHLSRAQLFEELQRASIFILLSKKPSERLPNVVKEALWAGCAVISSNSEGIDELLPNPGIGLIVDPDDPAAIAAALETLVAESPQAREQRRERAAAFVAAHFSSAASMAAYQQAWRGAISERRRGADGEAAMPLARDVSPREPSPA